MPDAAAALHAIVRGRVQGVSFRAFVQDQALALGISGWVRNLPDHRAVEVHAEGERKQLEELLQRLRRGPPAARVENIEVEWGAPSAGLSRFEVRH